MANLSYHEQVDRENTLKLRELIEDLPPYTKDYFRGIKPNTESRTRIAYAWDLSSFFNFLHENNPELGRKPIKDITLDDLENLRPVDIEEYLDHLMSYDDGERVNHELGLRRKLSTVRSFYKYFVRNETIRYNPADLVKPPKTHERAITRLDTDEVAILLDQTESGEGLTDKQLGYHEKTKVRDLAILTLMLGTGIRVSECVGLDLDDVDFKNDGISVHRKGGKESVVYFGDEVEKALLEYMEERKGITPQEGDENALFLSMQRRRISVRAVEKLVKKYARTVTTVKHITPHKLRSTYGTSLYRETGDIYLVADVLGHKDVNTTKRHYAAQDDDRRRQARSAVKLRD